MRLTGALARLVAAALGSAAAGLLVLPSSADAATCAPGAGVTVVVDYQDPGGGVVSVCDSGGGGQKASSLFPDNGFTLTYAQRQPGYVCRVQGVPTSDPCINTSPASAYWGLWWSDGKTGKWSYSSLGVTSLVIPAGGSVAFAWDDVDGSVQPGVAPPQQAAASPTPTPTPTPTVKPSPTVKPPPTSTPTTVPTPTVVESATPSEPSPSSASPTPTPSASESSTPSVTASVTQSASDHASSGAVKEEASTDAAPDAASDEGGLPTWVPIVLIAVLFGGAAAAVVRRRRTGT